jgi:AcrR family transcriptional regulator
MATLSVDDIAAAGLELVDRGGPDAFTMRAVADALGVSTMGLYHHVKSKSALVELLVERAYRERPLPTPSGNDWREDIWELATWMRDTIRAHPALPHLRHQHHVWTPSMLTLGEHWISLWQRSGLEFEASNEAALVSATAIIGYVHQEVSATGFTPPDDSMLSWLPNMRVLTNRTPDLGEGFHLLVRSLVDGIHASLSPRPGPSEPATATADA